MTSDFTQVFDEFGQKLFDEFVAPDLIALGIDPAKYSLRFDTTPLVTERHCADAILQEAHDAIAAEVDAQRAELCARLADELGVGFVPPKPDGKAVSDAEKLRQSRREQLRRNWEGGDP